MLSARTLSIRERAVQRGFDNLQTILSSKSQKHIGDDTPVLTKLDRELIATNNLNNTASRLDDANSILLKVISVLKDDTCSKNQRNQMANNIKSLLIPFCNLLEGFDLKRPACNTKLLHRLYRGRNLRTIGILDK